MECTSAKKTAWLHIKLGSAVGSSMVTDTQPEAEVWVRNLEGRAVIREECVGVHYSGSSGSR